jgi:rRNA maturation endonuclease Nob1
VSSKPLVINAPKRREQCLCGTFYPNGTPTVECPVCTARISRIVAGEVRPTRAPQRECVRCHKLFRSWEPPKNCAVCREALRGSSGGHRKGSGERKVARRLPR